MAAAGAGNLILIDARVLSQIVAPHRRKREAQPVAPPPAAPDLAQEETHVDRHRLRRLAGQHPLEVALRKPVFALEEESTREFQPHPHQTRRPHQHGVEGGDGPVQRRRLRHDFPFLMRLFKSVYMALVKVAKPREIKARHGAAKPSRL